MSKSLNVRNNEVVTDAKVTERSAMEDLKRSAGKNIGTVLTKVEEAESSKYGYGNYYCSYCGDSAN